MKKQSAEDRNLQQEKLFAEIKNSKCREQRNKLRKIINLITKRKYKKIKKVSTRKHSEIL